MNVAADDERCGHAHQAVLEHTLKGVSIPFFRLFYQLESLKSGMHHPDGILWIRQPGVAPRLIPDKVSLKNVAPTILSMFQVPRPPAMTGVPLNI
jgi:predicted AlkP superfamily phosphohydrolase/phosphomutase